MKVKYRVRHMIDRFTCYDTYNTVTLVKHWWVGNILYGYVDGFNTVAISKDDIVEVVV